MSFTPNPTRRQVAVAAGLLAMTVVPIVSMQQRDVTLQEIYESHLEAPHAG